MHVKMYTMRSVALADGRSTLVNLHLEFEGARAYVVWDSVTLRDYEFKTRVEINPKPLRKAGAHGCDFFYRGRLELPRPQDN
jgi:hypothetical protein